MVHATATVTYGVILGWNVFYFALKFVVSPNSEIFYFRVSFELQE